MFRFAAVSLEDISAHPGLYLLKTGAYSCNVQLGIICVALKRHPMSANDMFKRGACRG